MDEVVVLNDVSRYGLHRLHLVSSQAIDVEEQIERYVGDGIVETWFVYEEAELRVHHLRLYWRNRDGER